MKKYDELEIKVEVLSDDMITTSGEIGDISKENVTEWPEGWNR